MDEFKKLFSLIRVRKTNLIVCVVLIGLFFAFFQSYLFSEIESEPRITLGEFPNKLGDWQGQDAAGLDIRSLDILRLTSYVTKRYTDSRGRSVYVYIGYWANQTGEYQAAKHSPALCLPSNGWQTTPLDDILVGKEVVSTLEEPVHVRRIIGTKRTTSELFHYWFFSGDRYYSQEWYALINLSISNLLYGRSDGGIVEISAHIPGDSTKSSNIDDANQTLSDFTKELFPFLNAKIRNEP